MLLEPGSTPTASGGPVAIICALAQEAAAVVAILADAAESTLGPLTVHEGTIGGIAVRVALAGIGKVDAAMATTLLAAAGAGAFVMAGVAGALDPAVAIGDIVIGTGLLQHDYGLATDDGVIVYAPGQLPVPSVSPRQPARLDPGLEAAVRASLERVTLPPATIHLDEPPRRPAIHFGTIATGDIFVNGPAVRQRIAALGALAVDMESAAVWRVAQQFGLPCLVVRAASDLAGSESAFDMAAFLPVAARSVAHVVEIVLPVVAAARLTPA